MGFISPFTITAKILLQELRTTGVDGNEKLDCEHKRRARSWLQEVDVLSEAKIPSCILLWHVRLEPLSSLNIPRLEQMGDVLGLRLALAKVSGAKVLNIDKDLLEFWTHSVKAHSHGTIFT